MITLIHEQASLPCLQTDTLPGLPLWVRYEPASGDMALMLNGGEQLDVTVTETAPTIETLLNTTHNIMVLHVENGRLLNSLECRLRKFAPDGRELIG